MKAFFESNDNQVNLIEVNDIEFNSKYLKLDNGFAIIYGSITIEAGKESAIYNFPFDFKEVYKILAFHEWSYETYGFATVGSNTLSSASISIRDLTEGISKTRVGSVIIIGKWK